MTTTLDSLRDSLPDYARDLKLNLGSVLQSAVRIAAVIHAAACVLESESGPMQTTQTHGAAA